MLDFRVETFLCVCRFMNFTKASEALNITQPAVSQHIKYIEGYYNVKLFTYKNKKLYITEQGMYLKNRFEAIYHDSLRIKDELTNINKPSVIKIGATLSIGEYYLPSKMKQFLNQNHNINPSLTIADTKALLKLLDNGELDFALCEGYFNKNVYNYQLIKKDRLTALCAIDYDVSNIIKLEDIFKHRLLTREKGSGTREIFERYLNENGFSIDCFTNCCEFTSPHFIVKMLLAGQGISFLYHTVAEEYLLDGTLKEFYIPNFNVLHEFNVIWKKGSIFKEMYNIIVNDLLKQ